jgi:Cytoskeletal-regulatory complex EF hand
MVDPFAITSRERLKYEEQFKSLQPVNGIVTGLQARGFFLQSQLPTMVLGQIWALADTDADGKMNLNEFSIACKLINLKLRGLEIPQAVPPTLLASLANVGGTPTRTPTTGMSPLDPMKSIIQAGGGPPPKPPQPIIPPQSVPQAIIPQMAGAAVQPPMMMPMAGAMPTMVPAVPLIPSQPLIGQTAAMPIQQPPAVIPMTQPAMMGGYMQQPLIPGMGMGAAIPPVVPVQPIQPQQPLMAGIDLPLLDLGGVPPVVAPTIAAAPAPKIPAGPTPPQSAAPSRPMSISDKSPSLDSP